MTSLCDRSSAIDLNGRSTSLWRRPRLSATNAWVSTTGLCGFHFLPVDCRLAHEDGRLVEQGQTLITPLLYGKPEQLGRGGCGFHGNKLIVNALCRSADDRFAFAPGPVVEYVRYHGEVHPPMNEPYGDLIMSSERTCLCGPVDVSRILHEFACELAEKALGRVALALGLPPDPPSRRAIEVTRRFIRGEATEEELAVARNRCDLPGWVPRDVTEGVRHMAYWMSHADPGVAAHWVAGEACLGPLFHKDIFHPTRGSLGAALYMERMLEPPIRAALGMPE